MIHETAIAVFCYKRAGKLKASMDALLKNPECCSMNVHFFCDGHKNENDRQGVLDTRAYIDTIAGFKHVYKHFKERNVSTGPNFKEGLTYMCHNYKQFIVVEDDLVVTPNYIKYLLDALEFYKNQKSIFCITGYCFPIEKNSDYTYDTIIHNRFSSYGWASWSDRVQNVKFDKDELKQLMKTSPDFKRRLNSEGYDLYRMLVKQVEGRISTWDIQMQVHIAEHGLKVVYPIISKTTNIGFDNESTNTFGVDFLKTVLDTGDRRTFNFCPATVIEPSLQRQLKKPYTLNALAKRKIINTMIKLTAQVKKSA